MALLKKLFGGGATAKKEEKKPKKKEPAKPSFSFKGWDIASETQAREAIQKVMLRRPDGWSDHDYEFFISACRAWLKENKK